MAVARVCANWGGGCGSMGLKRVPGGCGRAKKERAARGVRRPDSWSPRRSREGDDPDRRGPPIGGRERKGKTERAAREEMGRGVGLGPAGREREREREKENWSGLG